MEVRKYAYIIILYFIMRVAVYSTGNIICMHKYECIFVCIFTKKKKEKS